MKYSKRKEKHGWTQTDKTETDCSTLFKFWQIPWVKVVFAQNHLVCGVQTVRIILSVKEFHITIFEF